MPQHQSSKTEIPDVIRIANRVAWLGRDATADVRLLHPAVSRRHATLEVSSGGLSVVDLNSRAGVRVNGTPIHGPRVLRDEDNVSFGPLVYVVKGQTLRRVASPEGIRLVAEGLTFRRGRSVILADAKLNITPNTFVGILGPSGAGKTTLLKGLTGFLPADSGQLLYDGTSVSDSPDAFRSSIGFVPQDDILLSDLTGRENLDFALRLRVTGDLPAAEREAWVQGTIDRLSLGEHADAKPVRKLSGGQRKRVSVGVELLTRPRLLFLDEPTAGLDPANEARLMRLFRDLARRGTTVVCTTHVLSSMDLLDFVIVVAGGRVVGGGSPANLLPHFGVTTYAELYEKFEKSPGPAAGTSPPLAPAPPVVGALKNIPLAPTPEAPGRQFLTLFHREAKTISRDRALLGLLVGQPLVMATFIILSQCNPSDLNLLFTFAAITSIWLGLNNTAREVVRHRALYVRERRASLNPASFLMAKSAVFAVIGLMQISLLIFLLRYLNLIKPGSPPANNLAQYSLLGWSAVLWCTYLSSMLLGLLVSTLSASEEVAVASLPLVILPQLLISAAGSNLMTKAYLYFAPLGLFASDGETRMPSEWLLEFGSLFTYSRPSLVFFLDYGSKINVDNDHPIKAGPADVAHLVCLLLMTATALVVVFAARERRWLKKA